VFTLLTDLRGFILRSERDGWNHLYLYDLDGNLIRRLTEGAWPVLRVVAVDEKGGWVYFIAQADAQRPYDTHLYRVDLEGKNFKQLTQAPGQHSPFRLRRRRKGIEFSPSKEFFLDTHSSVHRPPAVELRRADGTLLQILSKANIDALISELKWRPPEEFVVKAADGETDLYGILYKPFDFNPNKKYPVIEIIYAGSTYVPRTFVHGPWQQALAQLGFIVFIVDGRGTGERGKEFRDLVYGKMGRYEIPDHVAALRQVAEPRPYMDFTRVGVFGYSWGGYFALRALLQAPEVYQVGVAGAPITDMAEHWGNELNLGPPQENKEGYEFASNIRLAGNLKGKLLLIHGTSDRAVPFSHTVKMLEALIQANKPYDLIVLPGVGHELTPETIKYFWAAVRRYFQEHLKP
jgi:dipeptidyl aminopeptidase/acylaminoacyl peptidase